MAPEAQVRVRLATTNSHYALPENAPILVPTSFRRLALSSLVNNLLGNEQAVPFDFIIRGTYLRTSLEDFLTEHGISSETVVEAEYTPAQKPPKYVASFEHDDWVSAVDVLPGVQSVNGQARVLSSSYDGRLRVWNTSSQVLATSPSKNAGGHSSFIRDTKFISPTLLASGGFDRVARLWEYKEEKDSSSATITPLLELYGHTSCIDAIAVHAHSHRFLTASADHSIGLWSTRKSDAPAAPEDLVPRTVRENGKRRKLNPAVSVSQRGPLSLLRQHTQQVSGVTFDLKDPTVAYSSSWDQTMRTWDLVTSSVVDTRNTNQALFAIEQMPELHLVATGSAGRDIKMVDPRASAAAVTVMSLKGHKNAVVTLARGPDGHSLVSGSHDSTCRIWDLRTNQSLYTLGRESLKGQPAVEVGSGAQVYGVHWGELDILSAGQDRCVKVFRAVVAEAKSGKSTDVKAANGRHIEYRQSSRAEIALAWIGGALALIMLLFRVSEYWDAWEVRLWNMCQPGAFKDWLYERMVAAEARRAMDRALGARVRRRALARTRV